MLGSPTVPRITRDQMLEAIRVLGIDPNGVRSLCIKRHYVEVEMLVYNEDGHRCAAGDKAATSVTQIPIVDNMFAKRVPAVSGSGDDVDVEGDVA